MNDSTKLLIDVLTRFLLTVGGSWLLKLGFNSEDAAFIITGTVVLLVSLGYSIARNFNLRNQTPPTDTKAKNQTLGSGQSGNTLLILCLLMPALMFMGGCKSAGQRYASALVTYDSLNRSFIAAANSKLITDKQIVASQPFWQAGDKQIAILKADFAANATINETALKSFENVIDTIREWLIQIKRKH